jgi:hypothetical protein
MRRTCPLLGLLALIPVASTYGQETIAVPFGDLIAATSEQIAMDCERMLNLRASTTELAEREAEMSATVLCDCMPTALAALGRTRGPQTLISGAEFTALLLPEFDRCGAQTVRETTRRDCAKFTPPNAPPTYCTCFSDAVDALSDEEIVEDSIASRDNLEQRVLARRNSTPEPPLREGLLGQIDRQCRISAR